MIRFALAAAGLVFAPPAIAQHAMAGDGDHFADRDYPPAEMARARARMMAEHDGGSFAQLTFNLAELRIAPGGDSYRWDGEARIGGDIERLVVRTEGSAERGGAVDDAEVQALYSRAIDPYFDLQLGLRHDLRPRRQRSYASIGVEGLAPYMFDVEATLFLSTGGAVLARLEGWHDARITQRLILQPRAELNFAAQTSRATGTGAGLSDVELGIRLRYELAREFAPYVGVSYDAKIGRGADLARSDGDDPAATSLVAGIRFWF